MPKHKSDIVTDDSPSKKAKPTIIDTENEPDSQIQVLACELMMATTMDRDVSGLIATYTRPFVGELIDHELKITELDGILQSSDYLDAIQSYLSQYFYHGMVCDGVTKLQSVNIPFFTIIRDYVVRLFVINKKRKLAGAVYDCSFRVLKNVIYVYDSFEQHVLGYIKCGDLDPFVFVRDSSVDVFSQLNRGLTRFEIMSHGHNCNYISGFKSNCDTKLLVSVSHPTDTSSDTISVLTSSDVLAKIPLVDGECRFIFEITMNRFIEMVTYKDTPATFREVIYHSDRAPVSFKKLNTPLNTLRIDVIGWRWWCYQGMILGYNHNKTLFLVSFVGNDVNIQTFNMPFGPTKDLRNKFALCGRWLWWIIYHEDHVSIRRFSLDLRVLN